MSKSKDELKELIRLLKKAVASYKPHVGYRGVRSRGSKSGYTHRPSYVTRNFRYQPEPSYKPKPEKLSYHGGKVWTEPTQYKLEKERLVYDPEVKELLKRIEKHLTESEPDAEEMLKQLEQNPELYEKISGKLMEKMNEDYEALEKSSNITGYVFRDPSAGSSFRVESQEKLEGEDTQSREIDDKATTKIEEKSEVEKEASEGAVEQADVKSEFIDKEESEGYEDSSKDLYLENEADVLREIEADGLIEKAEPKEELDGVQPPDAEIEPSKDEATEHVQPLEANATEEAQGVIEQIEAQDLSSLEAELFSEPTESLEAEEETEA
jgi:hypothetical protein